MNQGPYGFACISAHALKCALTKDEPREKGRTCDFTLLRNKCWRSASRPLRSSGANEKPHSIHSQAQHWSINIWESHCVYMLQMKGKTPPKEYCHPVLPDMFFWRCSVTLLSCKWTHPDFSAILSMTSPGTEERVSRCPFPHGSIHTSTYIP